MPDIKTIPIKQLEVNKGQIEGLPQNPRFIRDQRYEALKKSIQDAPEMLSLRELLVMPHGKKYVVIGGNMRLRACKDLGYEEVPCKVLDKDTPVEKLREYAIKDNNGFGEDDWDILANEWDEVELLDWGMELPPEWGQDAQENEPEEKEKGINITYEIVFNNELEQNEWYRFIKDLKGKYDRDTISERLICAINDWRKNEETLH